jgi:hypothetical protein
MLAFCRESMVVRLFNSTLCSIGKHVREPGATPFDAATNFRPQMKKNVPPPQNALENPSQILD